jgi:hypothetical protein
MASRAVANSELTTPFNSEGVLLAMSASVLAIRIFSRRALSLVENEALQTAC